jgi:HTH-type transcriptional repressor of NAD biosynthesis genes
MNRGLVIGKFMPIHAGHIALIEFAKSQCDELIVSMSYTHKDPIEPQRRFSWIKEIFKNESNIIPEISLDDFDDESLPLEERTKIWADFLKGRFPKIDSIFSSEDYGPILAKHLGAHHYTFDVNREKFPVSATKIRVNPFLFWSFIPEVVRPYFVKIVCFYGPESTGKSTMAKHIAGIYKTEFVPEVAREMISSNEFDVEDIIRIGKAQTQRVKDKLKTANKILLCDTDLITTQIYSRQYLWTVPEILFELEKEIRYDKYFLLDIDVPWIADGLRDLGNQREKMMKVFEDELVKRNIQPIRVKGNWEERAKAIRIEIDKLLE